MVKQTSGPFLPLPGSYVSVVQRKATQGTKDQSEFGNDFWWGGTGTEAS